MKHLRAVFFGAFGSLIILLAVGATVSSIAQTSAKDSKIPTFEYDPSWPQPLPNNWVTGNIGGMALDSKDHIWVVQRPGSTTGLSERYGLEGNGACCFPAPPVLEFDVKGALLQSWGPIHDDKNQLLGKQTWGPYPDVEWPSNEHGIYVDYKNNVWVANQVAPSQVTKFTNDGKLLLRIGKTEGKSSNDTENFAGPTGMVVDPKTNEVFVSDGYRNRRVIVFDADTGAYKRHWGAYGKQPTDGPQGGNPVEGPYDPNSPSQQFATVHCIVESIDSLLYVCDRVNNRVQVFKTDGTYVSEGIVAHSKGFGAVHALGFSPDKAQRFLYVADPTNKKVWILERSSLKVLGSFGIPGHGGGQILLIHAMTVDSKGNIYLGESFDNNRVQKFKFVGMRPAPAMN